MIAAIVDGPSRAITCSRCSNARWHSSSSVVAEKALRYKKGPKKWTVPCVPVSLAHRRGSPVRLIASCVPPWYER